MAIYSRFSHWKWWFSIVMLVYQRVIHYVRDGSFVLEIQDHLNSLVTLDALRASWTSMNKVTCCRWRTLSSIAGTWRTTTGLPSGKLTVRYWKWPFIVDLPLKAWWFSIVTLVYQRVLKVEKRFEGHLGRDLSHSKVLLPALRQKPRVFQVTIKRNAKELVPWTDNEKYIIIDLKMPVAAVHLCF
jgi:hypothetical protein